MAGAARVRTATSFIWGVWVWGAGGVRRGCWGSGGGRGERGVRGRWGEGGVMPLIVAGEGGEERIGEGGVMHLIGGGEGRY